MIKRRPLRLVGVFLGCFVILSMIGLVPVMNARAGATGQIDSTPIAANPVPVYFFWGDGCPHCEATWAFWNEIRPRYPTMEVRAYEVWYDRGNQELLTRMANAFGFEPSAVPTIFIGERHWIGASEPIFKEIASMIEACSMSGCRDAGAGIVPGIAVPSSNAADSSQEPAAIPPIHGSGAGMNRPSDSEAGQILSIPFVGEVDLSTRSLMLSTTLIAFVDGFNPCSLWVLSVLLALSIHSGSRKRVFLVGFVFLTVTSLVYVLFIMGLFTMFTIVNFIKWIQAVAALAALFFAVVNIKDYFWYKQGLSFTIPDKNKAGIYAGMRRVMNAGDSTWTMLGAVVVLSAGVSLVEFSCTAGFPVLWTNLLISQEASVITFIGLILLYMLIYQIDELGVFSIAVLTLRAGRFEEKHGRLLKLAGGMLMLTLAVVLLVNPSWMNAIGSSLIVFLFAFGLTLLVLVIHRTILPRFGVYIGSEAGIHKTGRGSRRHVRHHA